MEVRKLESLPPPPGVIGALRAGFDVVASHVMLIVMPLLVDVFLWLGPRLSVETLLGPMYKLAFEQARIGLATQQDANRLTQIQGLFNEFLEHFNLVSLVSRLQMFPIGISSLMAKIMPIDSPLGEQNTVSISSGWLMLAWILLLVVIGWVAGGLYFRWVSETVLGVQGAGISPVRAVLQTFLLSVIWVFMLIGISIPLMILLAVLTFISPAVASGAAFLLLIFSFWFIVPLYFTPHGIFIRRQNAFSSIYTSLRMARFTLPTSAMFVFSVFILSTGLNYLWSVPPSNSWMLVIGIAGHAFITTALLAASFVYYRDMNAWLQMVFENLQQNNNAPARQV
jgi:hypothetical protein